MVQGSCTPFTQRQSVGEVGARLGQGGGEICSGQKISDGQADGRTGGQTDIYRAPAEP